jgi:hypothetical protein
MSLDTDGSARRPSVKLPACPDDNRQHWTNLILLRIRRLRVVLAYNQRVLQATVPCPECAVSSARPLLGGSA